MLKGTALASVKKYVAQLAESAGVPNAREMFSLLPLHETNLHKAIIHSDEFLQLITMMLVSQTKGQVIFTGNPQLFTGRTKNGRFNRQLDVDGNQYELYETDSGAFLPYNTLTAWGNAGDDGQFLSMMNDFTLRSYALDLLRVGFNGTHVATGDTDPEEYPQGEDVNIGWHEIVRKRTKAQIITDIPVFDRSSANADYRSYDAIAAELKHNFIREEFRNHPDLVVLIGSELIASDVVTMMNKIDRPTEHVAAQMLNRDIAGMKAYTPPFFPSRRIAVTTTKNLHHYTQANTMFRRADWIDDRKRFENNYLRTEGYAVEYDELYAAFDEINIGENTDGEVKEVVENQEQNEE